MKYQHHFLVAALICGTSLSAFAAVTASVENNHVASGDAVRLTLRRNGGSDGQPDLSPLKRDFDLLGTSSGSSVRIVNGQTSMQSQVDVMLAPKHGGTIQVPSIQWNGEQSVPLELTIGGQAIAGQGGSEASSGNAHVFLVTAVDQKQPYVQAAVVLSVRLFTDEPLAQASLDLPANADVSVTQLGKDVQSTESRGDYNYQIITRKYLLLPQHSGQVHLDGAVLEAKVQATSSDDASVDDGSFGSAFQHSPFAGMMSVMRPLHLRSKPIELNVLPRPAGVTGANWLPAQTLTLSESWGADNKSPRVGEPLTRHLHLEALGLTGAQLPDLATLAATPDGFKAYPDQAKVDDTPRDGTVLGSRDQDIAFVADRAGHYNVPSVKLSWWDAVHNVQRDAVLPARDLDVLPALAGSAHGVETQSTSAPSNLSMGASDLRGALPDIYKLGLDSPWKWVCFVIGLLWLATMLMWLRARRGPSSAQVKTPIEDKSMVVNANSEFKAFRRACRRQDPKAVRQHLLAWANVTWPNHPPLGLNALARLLDDEVLAESLRKLDRACYTNSAWKDGELPDLFAHRPVEKKENGRKEPIMDLYPEEIRAEKSR